MDAIIPALAAVAIAYAVGQRLPAPAQRLSRHSVDRHRLVLRTDRPLVIPGSSISLPPVPGATARAKRD
jgi:hypothetical protein